MAQPLILTLRIDEAAQVVYEDLRQRYFPPERNLIPAHLTLFHHLEDDDGTVEALQVAAASTPMFRARPQLRFIGRGVAVFFESEELLRLHAVLSSAFEDDLIAQDRQGFQPHIVVQNKVDPARARCTLAALQAHPFPEARAVGVMLWRYLGGPWEYVMDLPFGGELPGGS